MSENKTFIDFRSLRFPGLISSTTIPSGGTSDFIPEMWHNISQGRYECFVNKDSRLPFMAMPDALNYKFNETKTRTVKSRIYNVTSFNPSAIEFLIQCKIFILMRNYHIISIK